MLNGITKLNGLAEKISAAKAALFHISDTADLGVIKKSLLDTPRINEHEAASIGSDQATGSNAVKSGIQDYIAASDDFQETISDQDYEELKTYMPPLLLGFNGKTDYVELKYSCVADPETGVSVKPLVSVAASEDGKSGHIFLNGTLAACVDGAANISALDVKLVKIDG